eukprot:TRINITY_DN103653_c0_g1_i1.p1 TRINITY_DN103653_c0_g1~~TRINITY_DN103653_c0_g1_i1.p1  ORF type:complete len:550 (-),score=47.93 TRINITY_DN103653_c0_g1_i1:42-1634(-)
MERTRKFNIESLTRAQLLIAYVTALLFFLLFLFLGSAVGPPKVFDKQCKRWFQNPPPPGLDADESALKMMDQVTPEQFFVGGKPISHTVSQLSRWNQDFFFYMNVYRRPKIRNAKIGYEIEPLQLNIYVEKDMPESTVTTIPQDAARITYNRSLVCPYWRLNSTLCPDPSGLVAVQCEAPHSMSSTRCGICNRITLAHETFIGNATTYRIIIQVANDEDERHRLWNFLTKEDIQQIETMFVFPAESFTEFELYFRYMFVFVSMVVTVAFWITNRMYNPWRGFALEQKWTLILLVSLVLFNNPFFFFTVVVDSWFFPFLNLVFVNSFLIIYLLCLLLFSDNLLKRHKRMSTEWFYLPKLILIGSLWFVGLVSFLVSRRKQRDDIAMNDLENLSETGVAFFKVFAGIILGIYGLWLLYLITMLVIQWVEDTRHYLPRRVKFLWLLALLMLFGIVAGYYTLVLRQDEQMKAIEFFAFFALYNLHVYLLALMYYPTGPTTGGASYQPATIKGGISQPPEPEVDDNLIFDEDDDL